MLTSKKELWFIWGTAFSGSTLLGAALQTQPKIGFLGEPNHWFCDRDHLYCSRCHKFSDECSSRSLKNNPDFYKQAARLFPHIDVFISGNKHPSLDFQRGVSLPQDWHWRFIILSKSPHEFAHSWARHEGHVRDRQLVAAAMREWAEVYLHLHAYLQQLVTTWRRKLTIADIYRLQYCYLAEYPAAAVSSICTHFDQGFLGQIRDRIWQQPAVCQVNGNRAVMAQFDQDENFFSEVDPKYEGKMGLIFLDQAWKQDREFVRIAMAEYAAQSDLLDKALEVLEYEQRSVHFEHELRSL